MIEIFPLKAQYRIKENVILRINSDEKIIKANIAKNINKNKKNNYLLVL